MIRTARSRGPEFLKGFKDSICSTPARKPIRKAVPGTIQVFALYNEGRLYGAIETGEHDFYIKEPGKALYKTDAGRFSNVWLLAKTGWKLSESLSYDHHELRPADKFDAVYPAPPIRQSRQDHCADASAQYSFNGDGLDHGWRGRGSQSLWHL